MKELRDILQSLEPGEVKDASRIESVLANCWDEFDGHEAGGMEGYKLQGRVEEAHWEPPELSFTVERHGAAALGSSRAELQRWTVNLEAKTAEVLVEGYRQVRATAERIQISPLVNELIESIADGREDDRIQRLSDGTVKVKTSKIFPGDSGFKQTIEGRRKRFRDALQKRCGELGWEYERRRGFEICKPSR